jgi:hypothetical protein
VHSDKVIKVNCNGTNFPRFIGEERNHGYTTAKRISKGAAIACDALKRWEQSRIEERETLDS